MWRLFRKAELHPWVWFILISAAEAGVLWWVWNNCLVEPFTLPALAYGSVYCILIGFRILFKDLRHIDDVRIGIAEGNGVHTFDVQQNAMQFEAFMAMVQAAAAEYEASKAADKAEK